MVQKIQIKVLRSVTQWDTVSHIFDLINTDKSSFLKQIEDVKSKHFLTSN